jgi:hypothetical protein
MSTLILYPMVCLVLLLRFSFVLMGSAARMWRISFFVAANTWGLNDGQWAARLSLCENNPSTAVIAMYILNELTPQESSESDESVVTLKLDGKLGVHQNLHVALPDAVQYP